MSRFLTYLIRRALLLARALLFTGVALFTGAALFTDTLVVAQSPPAGPAESANLPAQPIGPNDLIAVSVYGAPELTLTVRVTEEGLIRLPMLRQKLLVANLLPGEIENRIAQALTEEQLLVDPAVTVTVADYHSRPISVAGAVKSPLTFQASTRTTLLEALTRAQGLSEEAGAEILVTRPARGTQPRPVTERIPVKGLIDAADPALNVALEGGEEVRVPQVGKVYIVGNVKRPGAFRIDEGGTTTVLKALALAEGLIPYATKQAYIYRRLDRGDGGSAEVTVELRKILDRKAPDQSLGPNDIFYIPDNRSRRATMSAIEKAIGFAAGTASGALVLSVRN